MIRVLAGGRIGRRVCGGSGLLFLGTLALGTQHRGTQKHKESGRGPLIARVCPEVSSVHYYYKNAPGSQGHLLT